MGVPTVLEEKRSTSHVSSAWWSLMCRRSERHNMAAAWNEQQVWQNFWLWCPGRLERFHRMPRCANSHKNHKCSTLFKSFLVEN